MAGTADKHQLKQDYFFLAKNAEQVERYRDMFTYALQLVLVDPTLTFEEQNLFCSATMNIIRPLYKSWYDLKFPTCGWEPLSKEYLRIIMGKHIYDFCKIVSRILDAHLIPCVRDNDKKAMVCYLTMRGDLYGLMGVVSVEPEKKKAAESGDTAYVEAKEVAKDFERLDATRLGVEHKYAVFRYTIFNDKKGARKILTDAFKEIILGVDCWAFMNKNYGDDTALVIEQMTENFTSLLNEV